MKPLTILIGVVVGLAVFLYSASFQEPTIYTEGLAKSALAYFIGSLLVCAVAANSVRAGLMFSAPFVVWGCFWWIVSGFSLENHGGLYAAFSLLAAFAAGVIVSKVRKSLGRAP
jgi:hypothetical protein